MADRISVFVAQHLVLQAKCASVTVRLFVLSQQPATQTQAHQLCARSSFRCLAKLKLARNVDCLMSQAKVQLHASARHSIGDAS